MCLGPREVAKPVGLSAAVWLAVLKSNQLHLSLNIVMCYSRHGNNCPEKRECVTIPVKGVRKCHEIQKTLILKGSV